MTSWQSGDVEANGIRMHYTRTGGAKPPVVLAHGFSDDGLCWLSVVEMLEPDYDAIMVDARGHGCSEDPAQGYTPTDQAHDLAGVIKALGLQHPVVLGHSMGAATALVLAGTYPDLLGAIVLEDPPARWMQDLTSPLASQEWQARMRVWITQMKRKTREELIAQQRIETPNWSEGELEPWADAKLRFSFNALSRNTEPALDWSATLRRITCPALLITGDPAHGAIITAESAAALQALVPHLRIAHIPQAGHSIRRDQFAGYMEVVRSFLAKQRHVG